jgi:hypothetical protein
MAAFVILTMLHYQLLAVPVFRPSLDLIRDNHVVEVVNPPRRGELQPDGAMIQMRIKF